MFKLLKRKRQIFIIVNRDGVICYNAFRRLKDAEKYISGLSNRYIENLFVE